MNQQSEHHEDSPMDDPLKGPVGDGAPDGDEDLRDVLADLYGEDASEFLDDDELHSDDLEGPVGMPPMENLAAMLEGEAGEFQQLSAEPPTGSSGRAQTRRRTRRYVLFSIDRAQYAVRMAHVTEIQRLPKFTRIPNTPDWVMGVTNLRGEIVSVIDLPDFLAVDEKPASKTAATTERFIVARAVHQDIAVGFFADHVVGIRAFEASEIREPTAPISGKMAPYIDGLVDYEGGLVTVLDFERLLTSDTLCQFETI